AFVSVRGRNSGVQAWMIVPRAKPLYQPGGETGRDIDLSRALSAGLLVPDRPDSPARAPARPRARFRQKSGTGTGRGTGTQLGNSIPIHSLPGSYRWRLAQRRKAMPQTQLGPVARHLHRLLGAHRVRDLTDAQLLQRFVTDREEEAFAV